jgi:hypothetical protein
MIEMVRFGIIVLIAALDNIAQETVLSLRTTRDFVRDRWHGAVRKVRARLQTR